MFRSSKVLATGGTFIQRSHQNDFHYHAGKGTIVPIDEELVNKALGGFDLLQEHVATAAFHNSGERFDPPKCHPNTRVAVIGKIVDWVMGLDAPALDALIMWLYGPAGAGKSAIAQSIAELCHEKGYLLASFFFGRSDPSRNHTRSLFSTIAYQISTILPSTRERILAAIDRDPLIFTRSLSSQFEALVIEPLQSLIDSGYFSEPNSPRLVIIDGLDECLDRQVQRVILDIISDALFRHRIPLIFLICSRPEYEISTAFSSTGMRGILTTVVLDDSYLPNDDIRLFFRDKFDSIKESHPLKEFIPSLWPTEGVVESLVDKSSSQFIYASTVVKYVASPRHRPTERLNVILNLHSAGQDMPFAELDALYMQILSSVADMEPVLHLLSFLILASYEVDDVERLLSLDPGQVQILLCDLGSIIGQVEDKGAKSFNLCILHASLSDFLLDPQRSNQFFIDIDFKRNEHLQACFRLLSSEHHQPNITSKAMLFIYCNIHKAVPTWELQDTISKFSLEPVYTAALDRDVFISDILYPYSTFHFMVMPSVFSWLKRVNFDGGETMFALKLKPFLQYLKRHIPKYYQDEDLTFLLATFNHPSNRYIPHHIFQLDQYRRDIDNTSLRLMFLRIFYPGYSHLITECLEDPQLSGEFAMDGTRYATASLRCLKYLSNPDPKPFLMEICLEEKEIQCNLPWIWRRRNTKRELSARTWIETQKQYKKMQLEAYYFSLSCLPDLLAKSGKSEGLVNFAAQHAFALRSDKFKKATERAKRAIAEYLERMESEEIK